MEGRSCETSFRLQFSTGGKSSCYACPDGSYASASGTEECIFYKTNSSSLQPATTNAISEMTATLNSANGTIPVFQFKAPYQLNEITDGIRGKMIHAISNILEVNPNMVFLEISSIVVRRWELLDQAGVLVNVGLINFHDSVSIFPTRLTQEHVNAQMTAEGLKAVQLIGMFLTGSRNIQT